MQDIIVYILFGVAVAYLAYFFGKKVAKKKKKNCSSGDCGC
jgi:uncharacterized membrane protein YuzA (DUF378 family)